MSGIQEPGYTVSETARRGVRRGPLRRLAHHGLRISTITAVILLTVLLIGFVRFSERVSSLSQPVAELSADAIVVLTGGAQRIERALELLAAGTGERLLISGVNPATSQAELQRLTGTSKSVFDCCVDIGYDALDTIGNANETASWIRKNGYHRVVVVTNAYHLPRSLLELETASPEVTFIAWPIEKGEGSATGTADDREKVRTLVYEYIKYQAAKVRRLAEQDPSSGLRASAATTRAASVAGQ